MLKILDFNLRSFNYTKFEFSLIKYFDFIENTVDTPTLYKFKLNTPFVIHLIDNKGNVIYYDVLCLTGSDSNNFTYIEASFIRLSNKIKELTAGCDDNFFKHNDILVMLYIKEHYVSSVDVKYSIDCMHDSLRELEKMHRDITYFWYM